MLFRQSGIVYTLQANWDCNLHWLGCHALQGLAFVMQRKAGLGASLNWGHSFVIWRQTDGSWSAPCFLRLRYASLGLTLGVQSIQSCHVLQVRLLSPFTRALYVHSASQQACSLSFFIALKAAGCGSR